MEKPINAKTVGGKPSAGEPSGPSDINIRSRSFLLARTVATCRYCRKQTALFALAVPPGHLTLDLLDHGEAESPTADTWVRADCAAFLFHIEFLPAALQGLLQQLTQSDRFGFSAGDPRGFWANHCEQCESLLEDEDLFCEPEGAFLPMSESGARLIHLLRIDEGFEAAAAGYAFEPQFFDAMARD